jgi:hypothetical protein
VAGSHPKSECGCLECRIREALRADDAPPAEDGTTTVDTGQALRVLCKVTAELLVHHSAAETKAFFFKLIAHRERWKEVHVMAQREPQGRA